MTISAILFDLDDTLMPEIAPVSEALAAVAHLATRRWSVDAQQMVAGVRRHGQSLWESYDGHAHWHGLGTAWWEVLAGPLDPQNPTETELASWAATFQQQTWRQALADQAIDDEAGVAALVQHFADEKRGRYQPYPQSLGLLEDLRRRYRLGLITNGASSIQRDKLHASGLGHLFHCVLVSGEFGQGKPAPAIFHEALRQLDTPPEQALMVGNSLPADVQGARAAGLSAIWIRPHSAPHGAEAPAGVTCINHIGELPQVL